MTRQTDATPHIPSSPPTIPLHPTYGKHGVRKCATAHLLSRLKYMTDKAPVSISLRHPSQTPQFVFLIPEDLCVGSVDIWRS